MKRKGSATWQGGLKDGKGTVSTESGGLTSVPYAFSNRFEEVKGANPEELVAAAHASCFAMATSAQLGNAGITAEKIAATATVTLEKVGDAFSITASELDVTLRAPGADRAALEKAVENAKTGCPVSKLLNAKISLNLKIES